MNIVFVCLCSAQHLFHKTKTVKYGKQSKTWHSLTCSTTLKRHEAFQIYFVHSAVRLSTPEIIPLCVANVRVYDHLHPSNVFSFLSVFFFFLFVPSHLLSNSPRRCNGTSVTGVYHSVIKLLNHRSDFHAAVVLRLAIRKAGVGAQCRTFFFLFFCW